MEGAGGSLVGRLCDFCVLLPLGDTTQIGKCAFTRETDTLCGLSMPIMPPPSPDLTVISFPAPLPILPFDPPQSLLPLLSFRFAAKLQFD